MKFYVKVTIKVKLTATTSLPVPLISRVGIVILESTPVGKYYQIFALVKLVF